MGVSGDVIDLGEREVLGLGAGRELLEAKVDCIGAVVKGGKGGVRAAGWRQQLNRLPRAKVSRRELQRLHCAVFPLRRLRLRRVRDCADRNPSLPGAGGRLRRGRNQRQVNPRIRIHRDLLP